jgi:hypothetical protein
MRSELVDLFLTDKASMSDWIVCISAFFLFALLAARM